MTYGLALLTGYHVEVYGRTGELLVKGTLKGFTSDGSVEGAGVLVVVDVDAVLEVPRALVRLVHPDPIPHEQQRVRTTSSVSQGQRGSRPTGPQ